MGVTAFVHDTDRTLTLVFVNTGAGKQVTVSGGNLPAQFNVYVSDAGRICQDAGVVSGAAAVTVPASSVVTLFGQGYTGTTVIRTAAAPHAGARAVTAGDARMYGLDGRRVLASVRHDHQGVHFVSVSDGSRGVGIRAIY
jgi:hypothetical protein